MLELIRTWTRHEHPHATAADFGLLVASIAALVVVVVFAFGGVVKGAF